MKGINIKKIQLSISKIMLARPPEKHRPGHAVTQIRKVVIVVKTARGKSGATIAGGAAIA